MTRHFAYGVQRPRCLLHKLGRRQIAEFARDLSQKRAAVIVKELGARGVPQNEIVAVGKGSDEPLVKPDNTPAKKAKNRRYEIRVRL